ncbi:Indole-3-acetic acid-amido synthetase GH3.17 [Holothuria leucospilota]|uniref:Indole-3-acetic acid-amido synthetase GH3.17 n=1 Tax=Holothuria leucospilota TaxID=206669 RepID=A0A9Q1HA55_HOLLE|nr:Indole-3-acetic acid-amido synthetase GH3.17 [Holothuria leucospilota]
MANKFFITSIILIFSSAVCGGLLIFGAMKWTHQWLIVGAIAIVPAVMCGVLGIVCFIISFQRASEHNTILSAFHFFIIKYYILYIGNRMLRRYRACCKDPRKVQEDRLLQIIKKNKNTDYGRQFQLGNINSLEDLRTRHPVTDYSHYEVFIDKIAMGENNVLTTEKITRLVLTSGTTGKGKRIPQNDHFHFCRKTLMEALQYEMFPDLQPMQPKLFLHCNSPVQKSECGIPIAPLSALEPHVVKNMVAYSTPPNGFLIENFDDAMYIHLLFALRERNLGLIFVTFTSLFLETMKYLQENWHKLVKDLARGTLNPDLKLLPHIRSSLTIALGSGDARRASKVQKEFEKGFDRILLRLWPYLKFIVAVDNVGIRDRLKASFAKGLKICSPMYITSEVLVGLNLCSFADEGDDYVLNLVDNVFEFVPESEM